MSPLCRALALVVPPATLLAALVSAQGVTTAGIQGVVAGADSAGIPNASVTVTNAATGERWQTVTGTRGRYALEYLSVGGPYTLEARAIGFTPASATGITLSLGERQRVDLVLFTAVAQLAELSVTAERDERLSPSRTGPAQSISGAMVTGLPVPNQDFSQLILLSPQAILTRDGGITIAGQSDRLNGFQIDGATNSDFGGITGLAGFGTPGAASGVRTLSVEALRELQILIAPFDVRYGNFAGGLVNAVTRSGSNRWEGSVTSYFQDQSLTGHDSAGNRAVDFSAKELTVTVGGPIVRDRAAFFVDAGLQRFVGASAPSIGDTTGGADTSTFGFHRADAVRFQDILRNTYHVDPGSIDQLPDRDPAGNVFAKISLWPALNQRIELSHNYARGTAEVAAVGNFGYPLSSLSSARPSTVNGTRLAWTTSGTGGLFNELTLARFGGRERCLPAVAYPELVVSVGVAALEAGTRNSCSQRFANQTIWELTDNASWTMGVHHLTIGTHDELIHLDGVRRPGVAAGRWFFDDLDSFEQGVASGYTRDVVVPSAAGKSADAFGVRQVGLYVQDQWTPLPGLTLTGGLRFDVPYLPSTPGRDPALASTSPLGINTAVTPSGNLLWSPRLGFNYDVGSRGTSFVRGGVGLFSGRPIYLYFSNIFETNGVNLFHIECSDSGDIPTFTIDPALQPTSCVSSAPGGFEINYFNPSFRFPRNLRLSLGTDVSLPGGVVGTIDLLYIRALDQLDLTDVNLMSPTTTSAGEDGRLLYGSFDADGFPTPNRRDPAYGPVIEMRNSSGDRAFSGTAQLQRRLGGGAEVTLAYTYTDARDRLAGNCFRVNCNLEIEPLDGTLDDRRLSASGFESRHKVTLGAVAALPLHFQVGLFYNGYSGHPYTYTVFGDVNADGLPLNDAVYLPKSAADITLVEPEKWAAFDTLIRSQPCLSAQRGHVMRRNNCRGAWATLLNARVSRGFGLGHGQSLELTMDLFNALNFFDRDWGVQRTFLLDPQTQPSILELRGYDQANQRGIYDFFPPDRRARDDYATRWRLQFGAHYAF